MNNYRKPYVKFIIVGLILFAGLVAFVVYMASRSSNKVDSIPITNYAAYVKNLAPTEQGIIQSTLYSTTALNVSDAGRLKNIVDAVIRKGSYKQTYENNIYTTTFIVDMKSVKQSYEIRDLYSNLSVEQSGLYDYTTLALCPSKTELIFGDFKCQDRVSQEANLSQSDPILQYLPVSTLTYTLKLDPSSKDLHIIAQIHLSDIDYSLGVEQSVNQYKSDIQQWFVSKGLNIQNYSITYEY